MPIRDNLFSKKQQSSSGSSEWGPSGSGPTTSGGDEDIKKLVSTANMYNLQVDVDATVLAGNFVRTVPRYYYNPSVKRYNILTSLNVNESGRFSDTIKSVILSETSTEKKIAVLYNDYVDGVYTLKVTLLKYSISNGSLVYLGSDIAPSSSLDMKSEKEIRISNVEVSSTGCAVAGITYCTPGGSKVVNSAIVVVGISNSKPVFSVISLVKEAGSYVNGYTVPTPTVVHKLNNNHFMVYDVLRRTAQYIQVTGSQSSPIISNIGTASNCGLPTGSGTDNTAISVDIIPDPADVYSFKLVEKLASNGQIRYESTTGEEGQELDYISCKLNVPTEGSVTNASLTTSSITENVDSVGNPNLYDCAYTTRYNMLAYVPVGERKSIVIRSLVFGNSSYSSIVLDVGSVVEKVMLLQNKLNTDSANLFVVYTSNGEKVCDIYEIEYDYENYCVNISYMSKFSIELDLLNYSYIPLNQDDNKTLIIGLKENTLIGYVVNFENERKKYYTVDVSNYTKKVNRKELGLGFEYPKNDQYYLENYASNHTDPIHSIYQPTGYCYYTPEAESDTSVGSDILPIVVQKKTTDPYFILQVNSKGLTVSKYEKDIGNVSDPSSAGGDQSVFEMSKEAEFIIDSAVTYSKLFMQMIRLTETKLLIVYGYTDQTVQTIALLDVVANTIDKISISNNNADKSVCYLLDCEMYSAEDKLAVAAIVESNYVTFVSVDPSNHIATSSTLVLDGTCTVLDAKLTLAGHAQYFNNVSILYNKSNVTFIKHINYDRFATSLSGFAHVGKEKPIFFENISYAMIVPLDVYDESSHNYMGMSMILGSANSATDSIYSVAYAEKEEIIGNTAPASCPRYNRTDTDKRYHADSSAYMRVNKANSSVLDEIVIFQSEKSSIVIDKDNNFPYTHAMVFYVLGKRTFAWGNKYNMRMPCSLGSISAVFEGFLYTVLDSNAVVGICFNIYNKTYFTSIGDTGIGDSDGTTLTHRQLNTSLEEILETTKTRTIEKDSVGIALSSGISGDLITVAVDGELNLEE